MSGNPYHPTNFPEPILIDGILYPPGIGASVVTDGTTTVNNVTTLAFTSGATVSSGGVGIADIAVSGGGSSSFVVNATPFLVNGTINNGNTVTAAALAAVSLIGNATTAAAIPTPIAIGAGLSLQASGTLVSTSSGGSVTSVATSGAGISGGPITTSGTLAVEWNAGTANALATGLSLSSATLTPQWQGGAVSTIGSGVTVASGTLSASGGTVTQIVGAAPLSGGTITTSGTLGLNTGAGVYVAGGTLLGDFQAGTVLAIGSGLALTSNTLAATGGTGTVTQVATTGAGISGGPITTTGTLAVEWNAGTANALGTGLSLSSNTLVPQWQGGSVTALGAGVTLASGTLSAGGSGGTVTQIVAGNGLAGGTITTAGTVSLGTIAASELFGNPQTVAAVPVGITIGAGVTLSTTGTLTAGGSGGTVTSVVIGASPFLNAGTITTTGTITAATLAAQSIIGNSTTAGAVPTAIALGNQFANTGGTLVLNRTLEYSLVGKPPASQVFQQVITEPGTLVANAGGAQGNVITNPTSAWPFVLATVHSGTPTTQGTISISTSGSITWPSFSAVALSAGDQVRITAPGTQDATGSDVALALRYLTN